jgi:hypothetical protein
MADLALNKGSKRKFFEIFKAKQHLFRSRPLPHEDSLPYVVMDFDNEYVVETHLPNPTIAT